MNIRLINKEILWLISLCVMVFSIKTNAETNVLQTKDNSLHVVEQKTPQVNLLKNQTFLTKFQRNQLYQQLINFIEAYDAEGIATRNFSKKISWQAYKEIKRKAFLESKNWQGLKKAFDQFAAGFVNLHSRFRFNPQIQKPQLRSSIKLAFTYPEISFFNLDSLQTINEINNKDIELIFNEFEQKSCAFNSTIGCLNSFAVNFHVGKTLIDDEKVETVTMGKEVVNVDYLDIESVSSKRSRRNEGVDVSRYHGWDVVVKGHKVAILQKLDHVLLIIKNFRYHKTGGDFRCAEPARELTMCADIQLIRQTFNQLDSSNKNLIIDVQNNGGGKENTPFMAELSHTAFKDLPVQFKNTSLLDNKTLRAGLFYGSERAESWYQSLTSGQKSLENDWLPVRADFCRGDKLCQLKWIKPNSQRKFKNIYILTNDTCVSSCDDLVWRLHEFSGAKVVGLPQAADATYSRISGTFYLDQENHIKYVVHADGEQGVFEGVKLFSIIIPYSKTLTESGEFRQGQAAPTQLLLSITKENFKTYDVDSLNELVRRINDSGL